MRSLSGPTEKGGSLLIPVFHSSFPGEEGKPLLGMPKLCLRFHRIRPTLVGTVPRGGTVLSGLWESDPGVLSLLSSLRTGGSVTSPFSHFRATKKEDPSFG